MSCAFAQQTWCTNQDLVAADGGYIYNAPQLHLLADGELVGIFPMDRYVSDAVHRGVKYAWYASKDGGLTWDALAAPPPEFVPLGLNNTPTRAWKLRNGSLLATGMHGWENFPEAERARLTAQGYYLFDAAAGNAPGVVSIIRRVLMSRSRDGGKSWHTKDVPLPFMPHLAIYGNAILLRDGTYVQPAWGRFDLKKEPKWVSSLALRTEDGGQHWEVATVARAADFDFNETSIAEAPNGDLVAVIRTTAQKELWTAFSTDRGKTWSAPRDSGMRGSTPWVVTTKQGLVVSVYTRRDKSLFPSTGIFACVSRDNGRTWDVGHEAQLRDNGPTRVDGYPQAVALPDGSVYAVYVLELSIPQRSNAEITSASRRTVVGGTHFSPLYQGPLILPYK
jgi:hypothetical protein